MSELHLLSTQQLITGLQDKQFSSAELTEHYIKRIDALDSKINSFITHTSETARAQAQAADEMRAQGDKRPLLGVPMAHKDIFCTQGVLTTCGSKMLHNFISPYDATIVLSFCYHDTLGYGAPSQFCGSFVMPGSARYCYSYIPVRSTKNVGNTETVTFIVDGQSYGSLVVKKADTSVYLTDSEMLDLGTVERLKYVNDKNTI